MRILVTGASGFIGREITGCLVSAGEYLVRAGSRNCAVVVEGSEPYRLNVLDLAGLEAAMAGCEYVIHCAVGDRATIVAGTANVLRAAQRAGIRRVVHLSSVSVYGGATGDVTEATRIISPGGAGYAHWKSLAESACRTASASGLDVVMLRPAIVYGAGSVLWVQQLASRIISGRWGSFGEIGEGFCNLVHVSDVAAAVLAALHSASSAAVFNINGPDIITWNAWFRHFAAAIGCGELPAISPATWRRRSLLSLPVKALVRLVPGLRAPFTKFLLGAPARTELALFALKAIYPPDLARLRMGWTPRVGLIEGMQDARHGLQQIGLIT